MKKLGYLVSLLVSTTSFYGTTVVADSLKLAHPSFDSKLTASVNEKLAVQPKIESQVKGIEVDQNSVLNNVNAALEQKVNQKLEALLATQIESLETQTLAQQ